MNRIRRTNPNVRYAIRKVDHRWVVYGGQRRVLGVYASWDAAMASLLKTVRPY